MKNKNNKIEIKIFTIFKYSSVVYWLMALKKNKLYILLYFSCMTHMYQAFFFYFHSFNFFFFFAETRYCTSSTYIPCNVLRRSRTWSRHYKHANWPFGFGFYIHICMYTQSHRQNVIYRIVPDNITGDIICIYLYRANVVIRCYFSLYILL